MLQLGPILLALIYALVMFCFSAWRLNRQLDQTSARLQDAELQAQIDKMAGAMQVRDIPVYVQDIPTINGLAAPDGRVFITQGFIDKYKLGEVSAGEIASVIAHELGHVALGHSRKRMIDFSGKTPCASPWVRSIAVFAWDRWDYCEWFGQPADGQTFTQ